MDGVRHWSAAKSFDYRFIDDQFFDLLPADYRKKAEGRLPVLSDLARLIMARNLILEGYEKTIWIDADVLIFDPEGFDVLLLTGAFVFAARYGYSLAPRRESGFFGMSIMRFACLREG